MGSIAAQEIQDDSANQSAVEQLQIELVTSKKLNGLDVLRAVAADLLQARPIHEVIFLKVLSSPSIQFSDLDLQRLATTIRDAMIRLPFDRADLFINYAKCSCLCMQKLSQ